MIAGVGALYKAFISFGYILSTSDLLRGFGWEAY
jgi:hypothetical protein